VKKKITGKKALYVGLVVVSLFVFLMVIVIGQAIKKKSFELSRAGQAPTNLLYLKLEAESTATLYMDTPEQVVGVDAILEYDPTVIEIISFTKHSNSPFISYPEVKAYPKDKKMYYSANLGTNVDTPPISGNSIPLAEITFSLKSSSPTSISFNFEKGSRNDSNMVSIENGVKDVLEGVTNLNLNNPATAMPRNQQTKTNEKSFFQKLFEFLF